MGKNSITNRLKSLQELDDISVKVSGSTKGTIRIVHKKHHAPEFKFIWYTEHFVGYFIDGNGKKSQAVVSLYTPMEAIRFVTAYAILNDIRSNQKAHTT